MSNVRLLGSFEVVDFDRNLIGELEFSSVTYFVTKTIDLTNGNKETFAYLKDKLMKLWPNDQPAGDLKMMLQLIENSEEIFNAIYLEPIKDEE